MIMMDDEREEWKGAGTRQKQKQNGALPPGIMIVHLIILLYRGSGIIKKVRE